LIYPSIDRLLERCNSKYALVVLAAKRARKLQNETLNQPGASTTRNVSRALWEIHDGVVRPKHFDSE